MKIGSPVLDGLFCIHKKPGYTSFETIRDIKKRLGIKKIGHTGTLDKFASGLLLVLVGGCTRLNSLFLPLYKEYRARICLGIETDTLDPEGKIVMKAGVPRFDEIEAVLPRFIGNILQKPPLFSALHHQGERAYKRARRGENIELPERPITIENITIVDFHSPFLTVNVRCSGGTYVRSLARDIGRAAGSCGYLEDLVRTRIGRFSLQDSVLPEDADPVVNLASPCDFLSYIDDCVIRTVKSEYKTRIICGGELSDDYLTGETKEGFFYGLFDENKELLAVVRKEENGYRYITVVSRGDP